ncbi:MAG: ankyrin repeat domain-containing protein [Magnetococcus sp. WYHC-3]
MMNMRTGGLALIVPALLMSSFVGQGTSLEGTPDTIRMSLSAQAIDGISVYDQAEAVLRSDAPLTALLETPEVDQIDLQGRTPLMWAAEQGHFQLVKKLLESGSDIQATDWWGQTALSLALANNHREIVDLIIQFDPESPS